MRQPATSRTASKSNSWQRSGKTRIKHKLRIFLLTKFVNKGTRTRATITILIVWWQHRNWKAVIVIGTSTSRSDLGLQGSCSRGHQVQELFLEWFEYGCRGIQVYREGTECWVILWAETITTGYYWLLSVLHTIFIRPLCYTRSLR